MTDFVCQSEASPNRAKLLRNRNNPSISIQKASVLWAQAWSQSLRWNLFGLLKLQLEKFGNNKLQIDRH